MANSPKPTKVPFNKIIGSKWTATKPKNGEKHFLVTRIADHKRREVKVECPVTKRSFITSYTSLVNAEEYLPGWQ